MHETIPQEPDRDAVIIEIAGITPLLARMAERVECDMLAYLLHLAAEEAAMQAAQR